MENKSNIYIYFSIHNATEEAVALLDGDKTVVLIKINPKTNVDKILDKESIRKMLQKSYDSLQTPVSRRIYAESIEKMLSYPGDYFIDSEKICANLESSLPSIIKRSKLLKNKKITVSIELLGNSEKDIDTLEVLQKLGNIDFSLAGKPVSYEEARDYFKTRYIKKTTHTNTKDLMPEYNSDTKEPLSKRISRKFQKKEEQEEDEDKIYIPNAIEINKDECKIFLFKETINCKLEEARSIIEQYQNEDFVINKKYDIDDPELNRIIPYLDGLDNIKLSLIGNDALVNIKDYQITKEYIDNIVNIISAYNLSPIERAMFAYDIIRDRVYKKEEKKDSTTKSRDITSVITGDRIVCAGYAKLYQVILKRLGINGITNRIISRYSDGSHLRNIAYIEDKKYNIKGIYNFDPTWDSKKSEGNNSFLNSYRYFALTRRTMNIESNNSYFDDTLNGFSYELFYNSIKTIKEKGIEKLPSKTLEVLNTLSLIVRNKPLIEDYSNIDEKEIIEQIEEYQSLVSPYNVISMRKLLMIMLNVREAEHDFDKEKYPFDIKTFKKVITNKNYIDVFRDTDERRTIFPGLYIRLANKEIPHRIKEVAIKR